MNDRFDDGSTDGELRRVRELLEAHSGRAQAEVTEAVEGVLAVTLDAQLRLVSATVLDTGIDLKARQALEQAIVAAVNRAMARVVRSSAEALQGLQRSDEWQRTAAALAEKFRAGVE